MTSCSHIYPKKSAGDELAQRPLKLAGLGNACAGINARVVGTWVIEKTDSDPVGSIARILTGDHRSRSTSDSGWLVMLSYELGRRIESKAVHSLSTRMGEANEFPIAVIQRWEAAESCTPPAGTYQVGELKSSMGKDGYISAVERTKGYIRAGDIYQANIAHHLVAPFSGDASECFDALSQAAEPRFGSMMIFDHAGIRHAIGSISPELFLQADLTARTIRTEPMKGTRPIGADAAELRDSIKDRAELDMITDLMRNDLGRVCTLGSVQVIETRKIEPHKSGVLQASSVIDGQLAEGVGITEIINATFPPGSVTGAPKVRAMQIIDELEDRARDSYCGSMMVIDDSGRINANVAIRTAHIWGGVDPRGSSSILNGQFVYPVGAGVVADSDPEAEWAETLIKAGVLRSALGLEVPDSI